LYAQTHFGNPGSTYLTSGVDFYAEICHPRIFTKKICNEIPRKVIFRVKSRKIDYICEKRLFYCICRGTAQHIALYKQSSSTKNVFLDIAVTIVAVVCSDRKM
jgi:hypothetical protein